MSKSDIELAKDYFGWNNDTMTAKPDCNECNGHGIVFESQHEGNTHYSGFNHPEPCQCVEHDNELCRGHRIIPVIHAGESTAEDCPACAGDDGDCQHKTGSVLYDDERVQVTRCDWGCDEILIELKNEELIIIEADWYGKLLEIYSAAVLYVDDINDDNLARLETAVAEGA